MPSNSEKWKKKKLIAGKMNTYDMSISALNFIDFFFFFGSIYTNNPQYLRLIHFPII